MSCWFGKTECYGFGPTPHAGIIKVSTQHTAPDPNTLHVGCWDTATQTLKHQAVSEIYRSANSKQHGKVSSLRTLQKRCSPDLAEPQDPEPAMKLKHPKLETSMKAPEPGVLL